MNSFDDNRPDPDELLASLKNEEEKSQKGKLKIFFGMCAGVGKTYSMLQTARIDQAKGVDIVIGYVETHKRVETDQLVNGLEIIPRREFEYKGTSLSEMDLDAIIKRKPRIVLIDELAHTNAPGCRHLKRYQDVQEILDHGINVYTTVNVQHLDSRADIVSQITGIIVRETVPDEIFENADEVELVDITPSELLERLSEGKVYATERSREAIKNFFRKGNITALREMSLRIVADRVDQQLKDYMQQKRIPGPWKSGLHLMVLIGPSPQSAMLARWAKNLSFTLGATLTALYVETTRPLAEIQQEQLGRNINLVKQLGAEFITTSGNDLEKAILSIARKENITHIIVGKPRTKQFQWTFSLGNFVQRLIRNSGNIDIYVLGSNEENDNQYLRINTLTKFTSPFSQYVITGSMVAVTSFICYPFTNYFGYQSVSLILLFLVSILATLMGIGPILFASTLSALIWDYYFIPPQFTFHITQPEDLLMLGMFFFIALVNGVLTSRVRKQESLTRDREERTNALFKLTKELAEADEIDEVIKIAVLNIKKHFDLDVIFVLQDGNNQLKDTQENRTDTLLTENDLSIASWAFRHAKKAGKFTDTLPSGALTFYPLIGTRLRPGVIVVGHQKNFKGDAEIFWDTFLTQISNAIEREYLDTLARKVDLLDESDKLYKTLFNTISHELRIPVAAIMGAAETMLTSTYQREVNNALNNEIFIASKRLNRLIENLLNMSRLESGRITPRIDWYDPHDLAEKVADNLRNELQPFHLDVVIPDDIPPVRIDFGLMEQVLHNLVYNATQYAPKESNIRIKMYHDNDFFFLEVMDRGPGFPKEAIRFIFDKFYRVEGSKSGGTGLGLSIVKGFVEAHKGTVKVENRNNGGARFTIKIPSELPQFNNIPE